MDPLHYVYMCTLAVCCFLLGVSTNMVYICKADVS